MTNLNRTSKNKFIDFIIQYQKYLENPPDEKFEEKIVKKFLFFKKKEKIKVIDNETTRIYAYKGEIFFEAFIKNGILFNSLFDFCEFVKFAEKVYFYRNDSDKPLYVDSAFYIDSDNPDINIKHNSHTFIINDGPITKNYQLLFKLEIVNDKITDQELQVIKLKVKRDFGRKMCNEFIIVNSNVKYNDISDMILIENINEILLKSITKTFNNIIDRVEELVSNNKRT